ncbi:MAG: bifunctional UDP-N-acetylglucosamine diphosphorylase/glucosamine-1-phosphate N-acetyltransferase GlmU [Alphaproteobacteria bacterium]|nr:MAG: bifunctional UDP-N-acetylglucosamine diphosphorylase/glucosamine-1-phosphate N-acetyltransferase GlmU [Alphaproteobacteria bacterium]
MTDHAIAAVILAAGKGTRMKSRLPKVLHPIGGRPMLHHLLDTLDRLNVARRVLVVGAEGDRVAASVADRDIAVVRQEPQEGTAHAVAMALPALTDFSGDVLVVYGDTPLLKGETLAALVAARRAESDGAAPGIALLGFRPADPGDYGRLVLDEGGRLERIVEAREASAAERAIGLCNSGVMVFDGALLPRLIERIGNDNAKGEYYLTDAVAIAREMGRRTVVVEASEDEVLGVNSRADLARAEAIFQRRMRVAAMASGVTLTAPETVFFSHDTVLGRDVTVAPHVVFGPGVEVAEGAVIGAFSHLEGARVEAGASVGPFARLRPGAVVGEGAKVGNFVEVKNAVLGASAKASHLSYLGDATIGAGANIGAGTITCNYDGFLKSRTEIGEGAFIGSNSALVAPVRIGAGAIVGAGSAIAKDVPDDALALTRSKQVTREGWAAAFRARRAKEKAARGKKE